MTVSHLLKVDRQQSVLGEGSDIARAFTVYGGFNPVDSLYTGFSGEIRDQLTGCYHLGQGYRTFNPVLMRFHSPDAISPFGLGGINAYAYSDPVNTRDPSGHNALFISAFAQRVMTAVVGTISIGKALLSKPPTTWVDRVILRMTVGGGGLSIAGAVGQTAGAASFAYVSNAGLGLAGAGTVAGFAKALYDERSSLGSRVLTNLRAAVGVKAKQPRSQDLEINSPAPHVPSASFPLPSAPPESPGFGLSAVALRPDVAVTVPRPFTSLELLESDMSYMSDMNKRVRQPA